MDASTWFWVWIIAAALLFIGEMLSLSFFMLPFAVGAVVAAVLNAIGLDLVWQIVVFIVVSVASLFALRPLARRWTRHGEKTKVGAERLVGMRGKVVEGKSQSGLFRVIVEGEPWNATTEEGVVLEPGTDIEVLLVSSNTLIVKALSADASSGSCPQGQGFE